MDIIFIEDLRAETWIGIYPREKAMPQTVEISLKIGVSTASAGASDDIRDTVDYAVVVERLRADLAASHFNLLEKLTEHIATWLLENFAAQGAGVGRQAGHDARRAARRRHHRTLDLGGCPPARRILYPGSPGKPCRFWPIFQVDRSWQV
jgi:dihydroneopterin aldolase